MKGRLRKDAEQGGPNPQIPGNCFRPLSFHKRSITLLSSFTLFWCCFLQMETKPASCCTLHNILLGAGGGLGYHSKCTVLTTRPHCNWSKSGICAAIHTAQQAQTFWTQPSFCSRADSLQSGLQAPGLGSEAIRPGSGSSKLHCQMSPKKEAATSQQLLTGPDKCFSALVEFARDSERFDSLLQKAAYRSPCLPPPPRPMHTLPFPLRSGKPFTGCSIASPC